MNGHAEFQQMQRPPWRIPAKRRPGACVPCRETKTKCDGLKPCTKCVAKRLKPRCIYRFPSSKHVSATKPKLATSNSIDSSTSPYWDPNVHDLERYPHRGPPHLFEDCNLFGPYCLARSISQFKAISVGDANTIFSDAVYNCNGQEAFEAASQTFTETITKSTDTDTQCSDTSTASQLVPHMLLKTLRPYLQDLYERACHIQSLIQRGRLVSAWIEVSSLVRQAETNNLHVKQSDTKQQYEEQELELRRRIWWMIIELEVHITTQVGREISMSIEHGVDRPLLDDVPPDVASLESARLDFRQYALDVICHLSALDSGPNALGDHDGLQALASLDRLQKLINNLPLFSSSIDNDRALNIEIADHHIDVYAFRLMLCCLLARSSQAQQSISKGEQESNSALVTMASSKTQKHARAHHRQEAYEYQHEILDSARYIVTMFKEINEVETPGQTCNWIRCFDAYTASAILAIAAIRGETKAQADLNLIGDSQKVFCWVSGLNPHFGFAETASYRLRELWSDARNVLRTPDLAARTIQQVVDQEPGEDSTPVKFVHVTDGQVGDSSSSLKRKRNSIKTDESPSLPPKKQRTNLASPKADSCSDKESLGSDSQVPPASDYPIQQVYQLNTASSVGHPLSTTFPNTHVQLLSQRSFSSPENSSLETRESADGWNQHFSALPYLYNRWHPPMILPQVPFNYQYWDGLTPQAYWNGAMEPDANLINNTPSGLDGAGHLFRRESGCFQEVNNVAASDTEPVHVYETSWRCDS